LKSENNIINDRQSNLSPPRTNIEGTIEPDVSLAARDFNSRSVKNALIEQNYEEATKLFRKAVESDRRCFTCQYNLGMSLIKNENYDESIKILIHLISINPNDANVQAGLGEAYYRKGLFKESIAPYEKAAMLKPKDALLFSNLGSAHF
jgi:Flp pilus assembly protein TadD